LHRRPIPQRPDGKVHQCLSSLHVFSHAQ
jgi:hypothetical protein